MLIELACICALLYGLISGWINGLFKELLSAGGFLIGLGLAYYYFKTVGCNLWVFIFITLATPIALGWVASLLTKALDHVIVAGFLNHLFGALLGCLKWAILVGFILLMLDKVEPLKQSINSML
ncbi:MAG: CvpA family protein [Bacteroidaceae bacterium]|jgi:uncharacterized membrane protein required for colicin V production|nr:CvpA family protein [Bacteroidaceae bacterium]